MVLMIVYSVLLVLGAALSVGVGLFTEWELGDVPGLWAFLVCYFVFLWVGWVVAVRLTEPHESAKAT